MWVCNCNAFNDRDVERCLNEKGSGASLSEVYKGCSGGRGPQCGSCLPTMRRMMEAHNAGQSASNQNEAGQAASGRNASNQNAQPPAPASRAG